MPRLFTAIELPDDLREELHRLRVPLPGARWLLPESYHITLRFGGDIGNNEAREFISNLSLIEPDGFELRLSGLGAFGGDDPRAIYAAVAPSAQLDELARAHEKAARKAGLGPDTRVFKPHVTLARLKHSNASDVANFLSQYSGYRSEPFYVTRTVLMSSRPGIGGGPYGIEDSFPMRGLGFLADDNEASW